MTAKPPNPTAVAENTGRTREQSSLSDNFEMKLQISSQAVNINRTPIIRVSAQKDFSGSPKITDHDKKISNKELFNDTII